MKPHFEGDLHLKGLRKPVDKTKWFVTTAAFWFTSSKGIVIKIPEGVFTDFASIPIGLRNIIARFGKHQRAAVLHDYLCTSRIFSRKIADELFLEAMGALDVGWVKRTVMFRAVRLYPIVTFKK